MNVTCLNPGTACSTVDLSGFHNYTYVDFLDFAKRLHKKMHHTAITSYTGVHRGVDYSFVFASTNGDTPNLVLNALDELGFYKTEESENKKNKTTVRLHVISVHPLMKKLNEMFPKEPKE